MIKENTQSRTREWLLRRGDTLLYLLIALVTLLLLSRYAGQKSFFADEVDQIGMVELCSSPLAILRVCAEVTDQTMPPLSPLLALLWYRLVPYGQRWLQLLPALLTSIGVFCMGLCGKKLRSVRFGVLTALLSAAIPQVLLTCGLQFRQYGLVFLFSALTLLCYAHRNERQGSERWGAIILYGVVMVGLPYTHYVSVYVCFALFLLDLALCIGGRVRWKCLVSYLIGAGLYLPWLFAILRSVAGKSDFWNQPPRLNDLFDALYFLSDDFGPVFLLFLLGCCIAWTAFFFAKGADRLNRETLFPFGFSLVPFTMVGLVFFYSKVVNPEMSLFINRYFLSAAPFVALVAAYAIEAVLAFLARENLRPAAQASVAVCLAVGLALTVRTVRLVQADADTVFEPYAEAADYLMEQPDIYDENVALVTSNESEYVTTGWTVYYLSRQGEREPKELFDYRRVFTEADAANYDTVYVFIEHAGLPSVSEATLNAFYEKDEASTGGDAWNVARYVRRAG